MHKFLSYGKQWIEEDDIESVVATLKSDFLTQGPGITEFEKKICDITKAKYCVVVSNGTAALHLAVSALELKGKSEGVTTPITFVATSNSMIYNNVKPIFADIDPKTYNIDPLEIKQKITQLSRLIIPVHFAGQPADMLGINSIAKESDLMVIEDASHAIGSYYQDGSLVGNCKYSDMTTFSFHPVKTLTTGEGGAITTNNSELYKKLLLLRTHGITKEPDQLEQNPGPWYYEMHELGFNYRITDFQAALGCSQINKLDRFVTRRKEIVKKYNHAFKDVEWLDIPYERNIGNSAFHLYVLLFDFDRIGLSRKEVMQKLQDKGIGTQVHYIPVHLQPYYKKNFGYREGDFPISEEYYSKCLSIHLFPKMNDEDVEYVIKKITELQES